MSYSDAVARHRSSMRKGVLKVLGPIYVFVMLYQGWQYLNVSRLANDHKMTDATITRSYPYADRHSNGFKSDYTYVVDGKSYTGTTESGGLQQQGTRFSVYYQPGSPSNHCLHEPERELEFMKLGLGVITFGYAFMTVLGLGLVSLTQPAGLRQEETQEEPGLNPK